MSLWGLGRNSSHSDFLFFLCVHLISPCAHCLPGRAATQEARPFPCDDGSLQRWRLLPGVRPATPGHSWSGREWRCPASQTTSCWAGLLSVYPWAALPLSTQSLGALIRGPWAMSQVWNPCCSHSLEYSLAHSPTRVFKIFTNYIKAFLLNVSLK